MNLSDLYAFIPEDMHGSIAVAVDTISITQEGALSPFILYRSAPHDAAALSLSPVAPAPLDEDVKYYLEQEQAQYIADMMAGGLRKASPPPTAPPVDPRPAAPEIAPKLSLFQRLTNFFTRSS